MSLQSCRAVTELFSASSRAAATKPHLWRQCNDGDDYVDDDDEHDDDDEEHDDDDDDDDVKSRGGGTKSSPICGE